MPESKETCSACKADLSTIKLKRSLDERLYKRCKCGKVTFYSASAIAATDPAPALDTQAAPEPAPEPAAEPAAEPPAPVPAGAPASPAVPPPAAAPDEPRYTPGPPPEEKGSGAGLAIALVVGAAAVAALAVSLAKKGGYNDPKNASTR